MGLCYSKPIPQTAPSGYDKKLFRDNIYAKCVDHDWWIPTESYLKLVEDLATVDFSSHWDREKVSNLIAGVHKAMPAEPGVRFPCAGRFVRVNKDLRKSFLLLVRHWHSNDSSEYYNIFDAIDPAALVSYDRDDFESGFGLVWVDTPVVIP